MVKELLREGISIHTCDRRSSRTYISDNFPSYEIETNFTEKDELWNGVTAETSSAQDTRSRTIINEIFNDEKAGTYVSITSHSGEIASILRVLGHRTFSLNTGAIIPVLVKAERKQVGSAQVLQSFGELMELFSDITDNHATLDCKLTLHDTTRDINIQWGLCLC